MYEELTEILRGSDNIVFFGGAGVSTESNIPDFRSEAGLYSAQSNYGMSPEQMLSHSFFVRDTETFFDYYKNKLDPEFGVGVPNGGMKTKILNYQTQEYEYDWRYREEKITIFVNGKKEVIKYYVTGFDNEVYLSKKHTLGVTASSAGARQTTAYGPYNYETKGDDEDPIYVIELDGDE